MSSRKSGGHGRSATGATATRVRWAWAALRPCPLADARDKAQAARQQVANDIDPIDQRAAERQAQAVQQAHATTFSEAAKAYIEANESGWRSDKRATQWRNSLGQRKGTPMSDMT